MIPFAQGEDGFGNSGVGEAGGRVEVGGMGLFVTTAVGVTGIVL